MVLSWINQHKEKQTKYKIDTTDVNPNANLTNATIFHLLRLGVFGGGGNKRTLGFTLGLRGFHDTNMRNAQMGDPTAKGFAFW